VLRRVAADLMDWLPRPVRHSFKARHYGRLLARELSTLDQDLCGCTALVRSGDNVLDIGANVGVWTHHLARLVGQSGRVWCFEPVPETCALLRSNIARFGLGNARVIEKAASDSERTLQMSIPRDARGIANHHLARIAASDESNSFPVQCTRLDAWLAEIGEPSISFLKIDTEGHELACIRGMQNLLSLSHPSVCIEVWSDLDIPGSDGWVIEKMLRERGYRAYLWTADGFQLRAPNQRSTNYFFLREEHLRRPDTPARR
jgi:FkbM family methyltransferase